MAACVAPLMCFEAERAEQPWGPDVTWVKAEILLQVTFLTFFSGNCIESQNLIL